MAKKAASESKSKDIKIKPAASMAELDREPVGYERQLLEDYFAMKESKVPAPEVKTTSPENGVMRITVEATDSTGEAVVRAQHSKAFGSVNDQFQQQRTFDLASTACDTKQLMDGNDQSLNAFIAAMYDIEPRDALEALLITQMMATHSAAITLLKRLKNCDTIKQQDSASNQANKLMRTFTAQMEALTRYRTKGQQKMTVEHVHDGGQAIVGQVAQGGGATEKDKGQSHAYAITHAPQPTLRSEDQKKDAVPVTSDAER